MPVPEHILNAQCPHDELYAECEDEGCNNYLRGIEEGRVVDNSAEAWEEDWNDSPQLGGMGGELRQEESGRGGVAATPPPVLTEVGQLQMRVNELEDALRRADSLAQLGATCFREHHAGQIEKAYAVLGGWRFALAIGLGLEGDAPWETIHDRIAELRRLADEQPETQVEEKD